MVKKISLRQFLKEVKSLYSKGKTSADMSYEIKSHLSVPKSVLVCNPVLGKDKLNGLRMNLYIKKKNTDMFDDQEFIKGLYLGDYCDEKSLVLGLDEAQFSKDKLPLQFINKMVVHKTTKLINGPTPTMPFGYFDLHSVEFSVNNYGRKAKKIEVSGDFAYKKAINKVKDYFKMDRSKIWFKRKDYKEIKKWYPDLFTFNPTPGYNVMYELSANMVPNIEGILKKPLLPYLTSSLYPESRPLNTYIQNYSRRIYAAEYMRHFKKILSGGFALIEQNPIPRRPLHGSFYNEDLVNQILHQILRPENNLSKADRKKQIYMILDHFDPDRLYLSRFGSDMKDDANLSDILDEDIMGQWHKLMFEGNISRKTEFPSEFYVQFKSMPKEFYPDHGNIIQLEGVGMKPQNRYRLRKYTRDDASYEIIDFHILLDNPSLGRVQQKILSRIGIEFI